MVFKKLFIFLGLIFSSGFATTAQCMNAMPSKAVAFSYQRIVATRYWHKTLAKMAQAFKQVPLSEVPEALKIAAKTLAKHFKGEEISLLPLIEQYPFLEKYKELVYEIATFATENKDVVALLKRLKEQGVILVLASNSQEDWIGYLKRTNTEVFGLFDIFCLGSTEIGKKPEARYFENLRNMVIKNASNENVEILFIDTSKADLKVAADLNLNFKTIEFTSAQELERKLIELGYLS